jgi:hypothetical protein
MQEFQQPSAIPGVMSDVEAQEVLHLYMTQTGGAPQISTADVAEAIRVPESQVQSLLAQVRAQKTASASVKPVRRRKIRDVAIACIAALIFIAVALGVARGLHSSSEQSAWMFETNSTYTLQTNTSSRSVKVHVPPVQADRGHELAEVLNTEATTNMRPDISSSGFKEDAAKTLSQLNSGNWDAYGIVHQPIALSVGPVTAHSSLPYYVGSDHAVQRLCIEQRLLRMTQLLQEIGQRARISSP